MHRARQVFPTGPTPPPQQQDPVGGMQGIPAIVNARLLTDKRHALVEDSEGNVACWDLVYGVCVEEYGQVSFKYVGVLCVCLMYVFGVCVFDVCVWCVCVFDVCVWCVCLLHVFGVCASCISHESYNTCC